MFIYLFVCMYAFSYLKNSWSSSLKIVENLSKTTSISVWPDWKSSFKLFCQSGLWRPKYNCTVQRSFWSQKFPDVSVIQLSHSRLQEHLYRDILQFLMVFPRSKQKLSLIHTNPVCMFTAALHVLKIRLIWFACGDDTQFLGQRFNILYLYYSVICSHKSSTKDQPIKNKHI